MLFKAEITSKTILDENKLVEQLYIFLNEYVPTRLIYESRDTIEDCIQDTIMYILGRLEELTQEIKASNPLDLITFNFEKWTYNRARSYISFWLRKLKKQRDLEREYIETAIYFLTNEPDTFTPDAVDYQLLEQLAVSYMLPINETRYLLQTLEQMLNDIGYTTTYEYEDLEITEEIKHIPLIAYVVLDEYIYESGVKDIEEL